jgi:hypothetical protein
MSPLWPEQGAARLLAGRLGWGPQICYGPVNPNHVSRAQDLAMSVSVWDVSKI